ncbi:MAG: hypothetical protein WC483_00705 [Candidatus Paceibacterota bacterium]
MIVYTFKNFPYINELSNTKVVIFEKLNKDIEAFCQTIIKIKPNFILGIARSEEKYSIVEKYTINKFHGNKKVISNARDKYELFIPNEIRKYCIIREKATESFCNLSAFKIKNFLINNDLDIPFSFIHVTQNDIVKIMNILNK